MDEQNRHKVIPFIREPAGLMTNANPILIPEGASQSCPETDISGHTVQKRKGSVKYLNLGTPNTGVFLNNTDPTVEKQYLDVSGWSGGETSPWDLSQYTDFTIEIALYPMSLLNNFASSCFIFAAATFNVEFKRTPTGIYAVYAEFSGSPDGFSMAYGFEPEVGQLVHIAIVKDGDAEYLYYNGVQVDNDTQTSTVTALSSDDRIWCGAGVDAYTSLGTGPFYGSVAEIRLWSVARSAANILAYHDRELDQSDAEWDSLECYLKCDEGCGGLLHDSSKNGRPGFFHTGSPIPTDGLLVHNKERRGLLFNGFHYGVATLTTATADDPFSVIRAGGKQWTVELDLQCWGNADTGAALPDEMGILQYGDSTNPLFRIYIDSPANAHVIKAELYVAGPVGYTLSSTFEPINGAPAHVVVRRIQNTAELIINGTIEDTVTVGDVAGYTITATDADNALYVGWDNVATHGKYIGILDELRVWNYARTENQISRWSGRRLRDARDDEGYKGLVGYWPMDRIQLENESCITVCETRKSIDAGDTYPMAIVFTPTPDDYDQSYLAGWGSADIIRRNPAQILAIGEHQQTVAQGEFFKGTDKPVVSGTVYVQSGAGLYRDEDDRWGFVAGNLDANRPSSFTTIDQYIVNCNGIGDNIKCDGIENASPVGIRQPASAPTAVYSDDGDLEGYYTWAYRFKNSRTGRTSLVSTRSDVYDATGGDEVTVTFTSMPSDPQVDRIQIFRTEGQDYSSYAETALLYFVDEVDLSSTTYVDNMPDTLLGDLLDDNNVMAPPCRYCATYKNMLVMAGNADNPTTVYVSMSSNFEAVGQEYEIGQGDGYPINALWVFNGALYVGKEKGIYALAGDSAYSMSVISMWPDRGVVSHQSVCQFENQIAFMDRDGIYAFNGVQFQKLSEPIDDWFNGETQRLNPDKYALTCATAYPEKRQIWFSAHYGDPEIDYGDLVGLWHLNTDPTSDDGYELRDSSSYGNHMTSYGTMTSADLVDGVYDNALQFDGIDDYLQITNNAAIGSIQVMSCGAWIKLDDTSVSSCLFSEWDSYLSPHGWRFLYNSSTGLEFVFYSSGSSTTVNTSTLLDAGVWYYCVATFDGTYITIYMNGDQVAQGAITTCGVPVPDMHDLAIGCRFAGTTKYELFNGSICEAFVSRTVLQESQIAEIYRRGVRAQNTTRRYTETQKTFIYNYDTGTWSESDKGYSALALVTSSGTQKLLCADGRNFVYQAGIGEIDGTDDTSTLCGIITDSTANSMTCINASFSTDQDGLAGLTVWLLDTSGDVVQTRHIISNTATVLTVDEDWSPGDVNGKEFIVGGIDWTYRSAPLHFGTISRVKIPRIFSVLQTASDAHTLRSDIGYNVVRNGLLDEWNTSSLAVNFSPTGSCVISQETDVPTGRTLLYSAKCVSTDSHAGIYTNIYNLVPGMDYIVRFWAKTNSATDDTMIVKVQRRDTWATLGSQSVDGTDWTRYSFTFTAADAIHYLGFEENEDDNTATYWVAEILVLPATLPNQLDSTTYTDLPVDQSINVSVRKNVAGSFTSELYLDLTDDYVRAVPQNSAGRVIEYEFSNRYPRQPVNLIAADLDIELTDVESV